MASIPGWDRIDKYTWKNPTTKVVIKLSRDPHPELPNRYVYNSKILIPGEEEKSLTPALYATRDIRELIYDYMRKHGASGAKT